MHEPTVLPTDRKHAIDTCRNLTGLHPGDTLNYLEFASNTLSQLEEVFRTIKKETSNTRHQHLAALGEYFANYVAEFIGSQHEDMRNHLRAAGVIPVEGEAA